MKSRLITILMMAAISIAICFQSIASAWEIDPQEEMFVFAIESEFSDWKVTSISSFGTSGNDFYDVVLMQVAEDMLWVRGVIAEKTDNSGENWRIAENAPIPLTDEGVRKASEVLAAFDLSTAHYYYANDFLESQSLLSESTFFLMNKGESLSCIYPYQGYLAAVVDNDAGQESLRLANWDGVAFRDTLATPMQESVSINEIHSSYGSLEIYGATSEELIELGKDGVWHLSVHTPYEAERFFLSSEGIAEAEKVEYDPYYSNDAWHYGTPTFPVSLPELVFSEIPNLEDAIRMLDPSDWACVKAEGAMLYEEQNGDPVASCFCRLPGKILEKDERWTKLQIGSDELGMTAWFHTEDLAFGKEIDKIICSFPCFNHWALENTPFVDDVCNQLGEDFYGLEFWLIGQKPSGEWLLLINQCLVCSLPPDIVGETAPTKHIWDEM